MAPTVGEQTEEVLRELLGYPAEKIAALREGGAFG
jgi:crotonobetainyl-CoA:carnitine CoA-transferase CaiB-like acyl-CoA transferase